jgi:hypothetical protein
MEMADEEDGRGSEGGEEFHKRAGE